MTKITRILLDMDDVLCDCTDAIMKHMGIHDWIREDYTISNRDVVQMYEIKTGIRFTSPQFWGHFKREFWANIPPTPWCYDLIAMASNYVEYENIGIATCPTDGDCLAGKMDWIEKYLPDWMHRQYLMTPVKQFCASPEVILVDDASENITMFAEAGGIGITLPQPWNHCKPQMGEELEYVEGWFRYHCRELVS